MESTVCVSGFLLLLCSTGVQLSRHPKQELALQEDYVIFDPNFSGVNDYVLYRVYGNGDLLLINCSQPERPQPDGYEVRCYNDTKDFYFQMSKLTMSQSGDYRAESWRGGNLTKYRSFRLAVCAEFGGVRKKFLCFGGSVELCSLNSTLGNGSSLQVYRFDWRLNRFILVLDTKSSLEPLVEDLKGQLQVDLDTFSVTLGGVIEQGTSFQCLLWSGAQCLNGSRLQVVMRAKLVFTHEEENVTLACIVEEELPDHVYWTTPTGRVQISINQTRPQEVMYMLNGSQTGDYSLIIPSVSLQHSGVYRCTESFKEIITELYVCTEVSPSDVMFSPGQSVLLDITEYNHWHYNIQWYRQKVLQPQVLIFYFCDYFNTAPVSLPGDLRGRVIVSTSPSNSSLIISNLTADDSGVYTWRIYRGHSCYEGTFHLVYLEPLEVHSPFYRVYASLLGCGLLGLVAAVIWFKLRSRRGEQTSGRQSREGQQRGDEDLHDDLEMAELNTPLSAVSDVAVEHSI